MYPASTPFCARKRRRGFTLVEIAVVVVIIGVLAALSLPAVMIAKTNARSAGFINDLRQARAIFEAYALQTGTFPPDGLPGIVPMGMTADDLRPLHWNEPTPIGGQWDWDFRQYGHTAGVSVFMPNFTRSQMAKVDSRIDDGDLTTGMFQERAGGFIYILE